MKYKYITENNLENTQTYMYSEYGGKEFLDCYMESRKVAMDEIDDAAAEEYIRNYLKNTDMNEASKELYDLWQQVHNGIGYEQRTQVDKYIKRFEVKKRIYGNYSADGKIIEESGYNEYVSYLLLGLILTRMYRVKNNLKYLSCLLKLTDTMISVKSLLDAEQIRILKAIIVMEVEFIEELLRRKEISIEGEIW